MVTQNCTSDGNQYCPSQNGHSWFRETRTSKKDSPSPYLDLKRPPPLQSCPVSIRSTWQTVFSICLRRGMRAPHSGGRAVCANSGPWITQPCPGKPANSGTGEGRPGAPFPPWQWGLALPHSSLHWELCIISASCLPSHLPLTWRAIRCYINVCWWNGSLNTKESFYTARPINVYLKIVLWKQQPLHC